MAEDSNLIPATTELFLGWLEKITPQIAEPTAEILANEQHRLDYHAQLYNRKEVERLIHLWNAQQEQRNGSA
jgi:hypothetical protein